MKLKILFSLLALLSTIPCWSNTKIQMEEYGGVYRIPCTVNGAKMKFIFDTGASNVCLSMAMAEYLMDNGYLSKDDIIGTGASTVADGRLVDHVRINLRELTVGGLRLENVNAMVVESQNAPLLMGQSAIQKLGPIRIEGNVLEIESGEGNEGLTEEQINKMFEDASALYKNRSYTSAKEIYTTLYDYQQLSDIGIMILADCLSHCDEDANAILYMNRVKNIPKLIEDGYDFYNTRGMMYYFAGDDTSAISDFEKAELYKVYDYKKSYVYRLWGKALLNLKRYSQAGDKLASAMNWKAEELGVPTDFLLRDCTYQLTKKEKSVKDDAADSIVFSIYRCSYLQGKTSEFDFKDMIIRWAYKGNKAAQQYCDDYKINYNYLYHLNPYN